MSQTAHLTQDDIVRLMEDRSSAAQADIVEKLSSHYSASAETSTQALSKTENVLAEEIFKLLLSRAEVQVRELIAKKLQNSPKLPPDIARQMISDVNEVALPVLQSSQVLSDEDLLHIIQTAGDEDKLIAIAARENVSESVSDALVETKVETVVSTLVRNVTAKISENTFGKIVEHHADSATVIESMLHRGSLPANVVEKITTRISDTIRTTMEAKYGAMEQWKDLQTAFQQGIELTSLKLMGLKTTDEQLLRLIKYLGDRGQLSPFAALCMANVQLFQVTMARMLHVPLSNMQQLMQDKHGLKAAYTKAELPESMFDAVDLCVRAILELEDAGRGADGSMPVLSPFQVMEKMVEMADGAEIEGMDYMLAMMQQHQRDNVRFQTTGAVD